MVRFPALAVLISLALTLPWSARADDLDDLDLGPPPSPASAAPAPVPGASAAPAAQAGGLVDDDDDILKGDIGLGTGPSLAGGTQATEAPAPSSLPGGLSDAWNLVTTLAFLREHKLDSRPSEPAFRSWQALRVSQELSAILAGGTDIPGPVKGLLERRIEGLLGRKTTGGEPGEEDLSLDIAAAPAPAKTSLAELPPASLDEEVERLARQLAVLDRSDLAKAQEAAQGLAARAGDPSIAPRLAAAAVHGPDLIPYTDRIRILVHAPPGAAWIVRQLASGQADNVQAALDYVRDGAPVAELSEVLSSIANGRIGEGPAAQVIQSIGALATEEILPDLEKISAPGVARAVGEAVGRIRQRSEEMATWRSGYTDADRRDAAARINQSGLPLFRSGQYREALLKFRTACELDPAEATYRYNHGSALCRLGNLADGIEHLKAAISIGRDEMSFYETTLNSLRDLGRRKELISYLEDRAPRVQYSAVVVLLYLNLAHEYVAAGRSSEAHQALDIAFSRAVPERYLTPLLARRGDAFMLTGDVSHARRAYQKALEYAPENRRALDGMLRADAWQPAGAGAGAGEVAGAGAGEPVLPSKKLVIEDDGLGLELDAPSPTASAGAPAAPAPKGAAPAPVASPKADDLNLDDI